ncbi:MAG: hypothetical protein ACRD4O_09555, partial [Bryobacteraceae bacterium]
MKQITLSHPLSLAALTLWLAACPLWLSAQTFYGAGTSAETSRHAGIYTPSSNNAIDALALNPAGLSALNSPVVDLSITGMMARGSFSNAANNGLPMSSN